MNDKTPAMILQELAIKITRSPPVFTPLSVLEGAHVNEFWCKVHVLGIEAIGKGRTKKEAKQNSARKALISLKEEGLYQNDEKLPNTHFRENDDLDESKLKKVCNYKGDLQEICSHHSLLAPEITEISAVGPPHAREFAYECRIGDSLRTRATGNTKKLARQIVAKDMLEKMNEIIPNAPHVLKDQQIKVWEVDQAAKEAYMEVALLGKNCGIQIQNYSKTFLKYLEQMNIQPSDIEPYYVIKPTEEDLKELSKKLNLSCEIEVVEGEVFTAFVTLKFEWNLTSMGQNNHRELAKEAAIDSMNRWLHSLQQAIILDGNRWRHLS